MTHDFLNAFVEQRMRDRGIERSELVMLQTWRDPASSNVVVKIASKEREERVILQTYMTELEMAAIMDATLTELFPQPQRLAPRVRRKRLAGRRGPLSPRHWMGAA